MILSASRRTDIPAFYSEWFINRLREGFVLVPNPYNAKQLHRVMLSPDIIDCIVFWTKDATPIIDKLSRIEELGYKDYYFEFTITAYDESMERQLRPKKEVIDTFRTLSDRIGPRRVDWRFDPIILNNQITEELILTRFEEMCKVLATYTTKCIISFVDIYKHMSPDLKDLSDEKKEYMAKYLSEIASSYNLCLYACSEEKDFSFFGINHSACIDKEKIENIIGYQLLTRKDAGQRKACDCVESVDIGVYNTCNNGCVYCYATKSQKLSERNRLLHNPHSPMLIGAPNGDEIVIPKIGRSFKNYQYHIRYGD